MTVHGTGSEWVSEWVTAPFWGYTQQQGQSKWGQQAHFSEWNFQLIWIFIFDNVELS